MNLYCLGLTNRIYTNRILNMRVQLPCQCESFVALRAEEILCLVMRLDHMRSEPLPCVEILFAFLTRKRPARIDLQIFTIIDEST